MKRYYLVTYRITTTTGTGFMHTGEIQVHAADRRKAKALATDWVYDKCPYYDKRISPLLRILFVERIRKVNLDKNVTLVTEE